MFNLFKKEKNMGLYVTDAYARIQCKKCGNKLVDELKPGQPFEGIKKCSCELKSKTTRVKKVVPKTEES